MTLEDYTASVERILGEPGAFHALCYVEPCACDWAGCTGWLWKWRPGVTRPLVAALLDGYGGPTPPLGYSAPHDVTAAPGTPEGV